MRGIAFLCALTLGLASSPLRAEEALSRDQIFAFAEQLGNTDSATSQKAFDALTALRSDEEIAHLVQANGKHFMLYQPIGEKLRMVFNSLGERAVKEVFAASVLSEGNRGERVPYASDILTNTLKSCAVPHLLEKLRKGNLAERDRASWALSQILYYGGLGENDPAEVTAALKAAATGDESDYVKRYALEALGGMKRHQADIPDLIGLLSNQTTAKAACEGLLRNARESAAAIPALKQGIQEQKLPVVEAVQALLAIAGPDVVPFVVENVRLAGLDRYQRNMLSQALARVAHPAAADFLGAELWNEDALDTSRAAAASFLAAVDHPSALGHLRRCLDVPYPEVVPLDHCNVQLRMAIDLRISAILGLGRRRDVVSYPKIVQMLANDPSIRVRTAAAQVLGSARYAGEGMVAALESCLRIDDRGDRADGHRGDALHAAVVTAFAGVGSNEALEVLYKGALGGPVQRQCLQFWCETEDRKAFEKFLDLSKTTAMDNASRSRILLSQLRRHRDQYSLAPEKAEQAKREFEATMQEAELFGKDVDLTAGGRFQVKIYHEFFSTGHVIVRAMALPAGLAWDDDRYDAEQTRSEVYEKRDKAWVPLR